MTETIRCEKCREIIFEGKMLYITNGKEDGIDGEYYDGCGECEVCGREFCDNCGSFEYGVCSECRKIIEAEDE